MNGVVCLVCPFAGDEKLKSIHVDLALWVWGPTLLSTHALLTPWTHAPPSFFFFPLPPPTFSLFSLFFFLFPSFSFCPFPCLFFLSSLTPPSFSPPLFLSLFFELFLLFFGCVCACIFVCMCVRIWQFQCVSGNDNVKHIKSKIRYVFYKKITKIK